MRRGVLALLIVVWAVGCGGSPPSAAPSATRDPESPYQTTREEFLLRTKACIEERGFSVTLDWQTAFVPAARTDDWYNWRRSPCGVRGEIDPVDYSAASVRVASRLAGTLRVDCLREAGYPPPVAPLEQVFVDTKGDWDPFQPCRCRTPASQTDMARCQNIEGTELQPASESPAAGDLTGLPSCRGPRSGRRLRSDYPARAGHRGVSSPG